MPNEKHAHPAVILFDGVCNLCNGSVNFIIDHDRRGFFSFASLQSDEGAELVREHGEDPEKLDSVILVMDGRLYKKSRAALEVARRLGGAWPVFYVFRIVPAPLRDFFYDIVAKNRYRWFGKRDTCRMPEPGIQDRFLKKAS